MSHARKPDTVTERVLPSSSSKSTSQIQETSRPSAMLSFRKTARSEFEPLAAIVRSTWLSPAGFLASMIWTSRPPTRIRSCRPKPAVAAFKPRWTAGRPKPSADEMDAILHKERVPVNGTRMTHQAPLATLPDG